MPWRRLRRTALNTPVLTAEGRVTLIDGILAPAVLLGLVLNATADWSWADARRPLRPRLHAGREARVALTSP